MTTRHTAKRDDALLRMLATLPTPLSGPIPVSALVKEAKKCDAFRRPDGRRLRNLRDAVHSVLKTLKAHGQIEMTEQPADSERDAGFGWCLIPRGSVFWDDWNAHKAEFKADGYRIEKRGQYGEQWGVSRASSLDRFLMRQLSAPNTNSP